MYRQFFHCFRTKFQGGQKSWRGETASRGPPALLWKKASIDPTSALNKLEKKETIDVSPAHHKLEYDGKFSNFKTSLLMKDTIHVVQISQSLSFRVLSISLKNLYCFLLFSVHLLLTPNSLLLFCDDMKYLSILGLQ